MPKVSGGAPTASGQEWKFYCSVGVDCSDAEPRCIWMAVLRCLSPSASPRRIPITSTQHRGCQRHLKHHRLTLVRGKTHSNSIFYDYLIDICCCQSSSGKAEFLFLTLDTSEFLTLFQKGVHKYVLSMFFIEKHV